jgi:hypothetical protein
MIGLPLDDVLELDELLEELEALGTFPSKYWVPLMVHDAPIPLFW